MSRTIRRKHKTKACVLRDRWIINTEEELIDCQQWRNTYEGLDLANAKRKSIALFHTNEKFTAQANYRRGKARIMRALRGTMRQRTKTAEHSLDMNWINRSYKGRFQMIWW